MPTFFLDVWCRLILGMAQKMWQCYLSSIFRAIHKVSHSEYGGKKLDEKQGKKRDESRTIN